MSSTSKTAFLAVAGPSGVGKGTILARLFEKYSHVFELSVSYTSRGPRPGEVDGKHYNFRSKEEILEGVQKGEFIESANVHGNIYGTAKAEVERIQAKNMVCVLEIDVQGTQQVRASSMGDAGRYVVIEPPSYEILEERLRGRGTETEEKVQLRMKNAISEIETLRTINPDAVIVNTDLEDAIETLFAKCREWFPHQMANEGEIIAPVPVATVVEQPQVQPTEQSGAASVESKSCCVLQ